MKYLAKLVASMIPEDYIEEMERIRQSRPGTPEARAVKLIVDFIYMKVWHEMEKMGYGVLARYFMMLYELVKEAERSPEFAKQVIQLVRELANEANGHSDNNREA